MQCMYKTRLNGSGFSGLRWMLSLYAGDGRVGHVVGWPHGWFATWFLGAAATKEMVQRQEEHELPLK